MKYNDLTPHQKLAYEEIRKFINDDSRQEFVLTGLAGTGKTSLLGVATEEFNLIPCSYTARAAAVLAEKCCRDPTTIHKLLYFPVEVIDPNTGEKRLTFTKNEVSYSGKIIAPDECSMIGKRIGSDLIGTGAKILACGDFGQLPPVKAERYYDWSDFELTEIMRQALDSPIIRQAHGVRNHGRYGNDTSDFRAVSKITNDDLLNADVRIVWKNDTRIAMNEKIRKLNGFKKSHPQKGEPVVCLHNCPTFGIYNGCVYELLADFNPEKDREMILDVGGDEVAIPKVQMVHKVEEMQKGASTCFDFGYVLTAHKCQGSEWDNVAIIDEHRIPHERRCWLYTALTRAKKTVIIQQ